MKIFYLLCLICPILNGMEHGHIEARTNGSHIVIDIEAANELKRSHHVSGVELAPSEPESDKTKLKIAGITAGATACTAMTALCTALVTAGVTVAITYSQCDK